MPRRRVSKYKRPGYKSCAKMVYGDASKALRIAKNVASLMNVEIKNHDVQQTNIVLTTAPIITQLSNIQQGDTTNHRDGSQCKVIFIEMSYSILVDSTLPRTICRIMLVLDKQTNQAIYVNTDLLEDVTVHDNILAPVNLDNKHRFSVLYDRTHVLSLSVPVVYVKRIFRRQTLLRFDASTPSIADLTQNSLSLVQMTNEGANQPAITSFLRIRFVDN